MAPKVNTNMIAEIAKISILGYHGVLSFQITLFTT